MPKQPTLPESFFELCLRYEYFKRSSVQLARRNLKQMVDSITEDIARGLSGQRLESQDLSTPQGPWPPLQEIPRYTITIMLPDWYFDKEPTSDSDDSGVDEKRIDVNSIEEIQGFYTRFAEQEVFTIWKKPQFQLKDVYRLLAIRRIASERISKWINLPWISLTIFIRYRVIVFLIYHPSNPDDNLKIFYQSCDGGSYIYYGGHGTSIETTKYQSLAAQDFYFLVQNQNMKFEDITIRIDQDIYLQGPPFTSFFWKVEKYLKTLNHKVKVENFDIEAIEIEDHRTSRQTTILAILPFLDVLLSLRIEIVSRLESISLSKAVTDLEAWKNCPNLDVNDRKIWFPNYTPLASFHTVQITLPREHIRKCLIDIGTAAPLAQDKLLPWRNTTEKWKLRIRVQLDRTFVSNRLNDLRKVRLELLKNLKFRLSHQRGVTEIVIENKKEISYMSHQAFKMWRRRK